MTTHLQCQASVTPDAFDLTFIPADPNAADAMFSTRDLRQALELKLNMPHGQTSAPTRTRAPLQPVPAGLAMRGETVAANEDSYRHRPKEEQEALIALQTQLIRDLRAHTPDLGAARDLLIPLNRALNAVDTFSPERAAMFGALIEHMAPLAAHPSQLPSSLSSAIPSPSAVIPAQAGIPALLEHLATLAPIAQTLFDQALLTTPLLQAIHKRITAHTSPEIQATPAFKQLVAPLAARTDPTFTLTQAKQNLLERVITPATAITQQSPSPSTANPPVSSVIPSPSAVIPAACPPKPEGRRGKAGIPTITAHHAPTTTTQPPREATSALNTAVPVLSGAANTVTPSTARAVPSSAPIADATTISVIPDIIVAAAVFGPPADTPLSSAPVLERAAPALTTAVEPITTTRQQPREATPAPPHVEITAAPSLSVISPPQPPRTNTQEPTISTGVPIYPPPRPPVSDPVSTPPPATAPATPARTATAGPTAPSPAVPPAAAPPPAPKKDFTTACGGGPNCQCHPTIDATRIAQIAQERAEAAASREQIAQIRAIREKAAAALSPSQATSPMGEAFAACGPNCADPDHNHGGATILHTAQAETVTAGNNLEDFFFSDAAPAAEKDKKSPEPIAA